MSRSLRSAKRAAPPDNDDGGDGSATSDQGQGGKADTSQGQKRQKTTGQTKKPSTSAGASNTGQSPEKEQSSEKEQGAEEVKSGEKDQVPEGEQAAQSERRSQREVSSDRESGEISESEEVAAEERGLSKAASQEGGGRGFGTFDPQASLPRESLADSPYRSPRRSNYPASPPRRYNRPRGIDTGGHDLQPQRRSHTSYSDFINRTRPFSISNTASGNVVNNHYYGRVPSDSPHQQPQEASPTPLPGGRTAADRINAPLTARGDNRSRASSTHGSAPGTPRQPIFGHDYATFGRHLGFSDTHTYRDFAPGVIIEGPHMVSNLNPNAPYSRIVKSSNVGLIDACWRKMIVVRNYMDHLIVVVVATYNGNGMDHKSQTMLDEHIPIFEADDVPDGLKVKYLVVHPSHLEPSSRDQYDDRKRVIRNSWVALSRPVVIEHRYNILIRGKLTEASTRLLLQRYDMIQDKGLEPPERQQEWQRRQLQDIERRERRSPRTRRASRSPSKR